LLLNFRKFEKNVIVTELKFYQYKSDSRLLFNILQQKIISMPFYSILFFLFSDFIRIKLKSENILSIDAKLE